MTSHRDSLVLLGHAATFVGIAEIPGAKHDSRIVAMLKHVGIQRGGDETPWCAAFVNWILENYGAPGTNSARARSFEDWGEPVDIEDAQPGDVFVLWRKKPNSRAGHVGFLQRFERGRRRVCLIGGNQRNRVGSKSFPVGRVVAVRRLPGCVPAP